ncbi:aspartate--tRNA ligase [Culicoidibacter larvae]|uniref:Aspartate--tRNA ligase n=1 Tax=Culicoidibacter larvae TaxID=2579976 RepID=A0A5R8QCR9_9FIRM|nr:aspartate--tRNA ligase [Culicoidibacter larvae]TLG74325.1 aspartate--tRNA ligase [Culicoidibacter larvae]
MSNELFNCAALRSSDIGKKVRLRGFVAKERNLGGLIFIDLRDSKGITQIVIHPDNKNYELAKTIRTEFVIEVSGEVIARESINKHIPTGDIEVIAEEVTIVSKAKTTPFVISDDSEVLEDTRMTYRYLDLRRASIKERIIERAKINRSIRNFFDNNDFIEIETPILSKSTPEGARDYLVPSRIHEGTFYALPQSPQIYKQLLMLSGFERYYQIARCFRDEDLRTDRQPEFTQLDLEMSFASETEIRSFLEQAMVQMMKDVKGVDIPAPFPTLGFDEAMARYGSDKPDTRFALELINVTDIVATMDFKVFSEAPMVNLLNVKGAADKFSRKDIDKLGEFAAIYKAKGLAWVKYTDGAFNGPISKFITDIHALELKERADVEEGDLLLFVADQKSVVQASLGALRSKLGKELNLIDRNQYNFLWIIDWPLFEYDEDTKTYAAAHHPFTAVKPEHEQFLIDNKPELCYAQAYDLVLNGYELGSGSIRITDPEMQMHMFRALGFSEEEAQEQFGFLIEAYQYGAPSHGGMGIGIDRIAMILTDTDIISDVVAFPKTLSARDLMMDSPSPVDTVQLDDLGIMVKEGK